MQKWPYACTKTGASTGLALFDKQDQVVVGSHGQRASSCRTRGGRAQPGMPGCSSLMSAVPKTSERKGKGSKIGAGALQLSVQGALFDTRVYARLRLRCQVVLVLVPPVCSKDGTCMHTRSLRAAGDRGVLVSQTLPPLRLAPGKAKQSARTARDRRMGDQRIVKLRPKETRQATSPLLPALLVHNARRGRPSPRLLSSRQFPASA